MMDLKRKSIQNKKCFKIYIKCGVRSANALKLQSKVLLKADCVPELLVWRRDIAAYLVDTCSKQASAFIA